MNCALIALNFNSSMYISLLTCTNNSKHNLIDGYNIIDISLHESYHLLIQLKESNFTQLNTVAC